MRAVRTKIGGAGLLVAAVTTVLGGLPAKAAGPAELCRLVDPRMDEVSGLVATPTGFVAMNDGKPGTTVLRLFVLDRGCRVTKVRADAGFDPLDPEDLASTPDGTLWAGDLGDNDATRETVAIDRIPAGAAAGTSYRLTYPDGAHDAEALLVQPDGVVTIVTKELSGVAGIYVSTRPLAGPTATVPMASAGTVSIAPTDTAGGPDIGAFASTLITGGALAPDGRRIVLRTYTDAYEWDVPNGDLAAALSRTEPRRTPLPGEPHGEAISYTTDGAAFVTTSEGAGQPIRRWTPAPRPTPSPSPAAKAAPAGSGDVADSGDRAAPFRSAPVLGGLALGGAALIAVGVLGARRLRHRARRR